MYLQTKKNVISKNDYDFDMKTSRKVKVLNERIQMGESYLMHRTK